jgi:mono/diheme cytochrome c family protein
MHFGSREAFPQSQGRLTLRTLIFNVFAAGLLASAAFADPQTDYMLNCRGCHGPDGSGIAEGAPSFRGYVAKFLWVPGGREYLIRVPGTAQSELSDARTAALLNWILQEFSPNQIPANFAPYTADEVARLRHSPLTDVGAVRRALAEAIAARAAADARSDGAASSGRTGEACTPRRAVVQGIADRYQNLIDGTPCGKVESPPID